MLEALERLQNAQLLFYKASGCLLAQYFPIVSSEVPVSSTDHFDNGTEQAHLPQFKMAPKLASASENVGGTTHYTDLSSVLPQRTQPWWKTPHLVKLNLLLSVPMMTGYLIGFDSSMMNGLQSVPVWISGEFKSWCIADEADIRRL
jgi:hypothetical protein